MSDYISREDAIKAMGIRIDTLYYKESDSLRNKINAIPAADVAPVVRLGKDRLTKLGVNGIYGLVKVKDDEQEVECRSRNTAQCIMDSWERLAAYEDTGLSPADIPALTARAEAAEAERDACKADLKSMADWYRDSVCDDGICGWCKQDADHGLDGDANECAGFYKNDCFEWRGPCAAEGEKHG